MNPLETLVAANPLPRLFSGAGLVMGIIAAFLVWAYYAELDEVAVASGKIVPKGQVKVIQHLEGGIIHKINVTEGQKVRAEAPLVELRLGTEAVNRDEVEIETKSLLLKKARLEAESTGSKLVFPKGLAARYDGMVSAERKAYESRRRQWQSNQVIFREQTSQKTHAIRESTARLKGIKEKLKLVERRFVMSKDLLASKLVPKMEHLELEDEVTSLRAEADELSKRLPNLRAAHAEARERERTGLINFQRAVIEELQQVELSIARNRELITKVGDQSSRREIRSPIDGIVKNLRYHTVGGVVRPGEAIMEIVPSDENLVVELNLNPVDVGYVRVGQPTVVKVTSFDFARYGGLEGRVINIAPDSSIEQDGTAYFRVMVETSKDYLGDEPGVNRIIPGMLATGDIHTGYRSVLDYFIAPVLKLKHEAFRER